MTRDERIQAIQSVVAEKNRANDNDTLQDLFAKAAAVKISSAFIIRLWHNQVILEKESAKTIDFLYNTLVENGVTERPSQEPVDLKFFRKNKLLFLDDESVPASVRRRCNPIFRGLYQVELEKDCDIAELDRPTLARAFETLGHYNRKYIATSLSVLHQYLKWCVKAGLPTAECWKNGELISVDEINTVEAFRSCCYRDAAMLRHTIEENSVINNLHAGPPLAVLAWMDFDLEEALDIKTEEVDRDRQTIRGRAVPTELWHIIALYYQIGDAIIDVGAGGGYRSMYVADLGFFLKARSRNEESAGKPLNASAAKTAMNSIGMTYKDIQMSSRYSRLHEISQHRFPTESEICSLFQIETPETKGSRWKMQTEIATRLHEYQSFCNAFYHSERP